MIRSENAQDPADMQPFVVDKREQAVRGLGRDGPSISIVIQDGINDDCIGCVRIHDDVLPS